MFWISFPIMASVSVDLIQKKIFKKDPSKNLFKNAIVNTLTAVGTQSTVGIADMANLAKTHYLDLQKSCKVDVLEYGLSKCDILPDDATADTTLTCGLMKHQNVIVIKSRDILYSNYIDFSRKISAALDIIISSKLSFMGSECRTKVQNCNIQENGNCYISKASLNYLDFSGSSLTCNYLLKECTFTGDASKLPISKYDRDLMGLNSNSPTLVDELCIFYE